MLSRLSSSACVLRYAPRAARSLVTVSAFSQLPVSAISGTVGRSFSSNSYKQQQQQQQYTSASSWVLPILTATALGACILTEERNSRTLAANAEPDYAAVKRAIADTLDDENYDDGSRGPVLVRLAWHAAGTFDKSSSSGGSNGATMRFPPESSDGANAGLDKARAFLEPIKKKFPWISYADLWTLAGVVAIEEMGGPKVPWRPGRTDAVDGKAAPPNGRLPDASKRQDHIRQVFYRMGFNDQEIVALVGGGHAIGRCHKDRSGYVGPWTNSPTTFSNEFFRILLEEKWTLHNKEGPNKSQYEDKSKQLMMLPADMALIEDKNFKVWVDLYAKDNDKFFKDFSAAFSKLLELGVKFPKDAKYV